MVYFYTQKFSIPSYLITIDAGEIKVKKISDIIKIYIEEKMTDKTAYELSDAENFIYYLNFMLIIINMENIIFLFFDGR